MISDDLVDEEDERLAGASNCPECGCLVEQETYERDCCSPSCGDSIWIRRYFCRVCRVFYDAW